MTSAKRLFCLVVCFLLTAASYAQSPILDTLNNYDLSIEVIGGVGNGEHYYRGTGVERAYLYTAAGKINKKIIPIFGENPWPCGEVLVISVNDDVVMVFYHGAIYMKKNGYITMSTRQPDAKCMCYMLIHPTKLPSEIEEILK